MEIRIIITGRYQSGQMGLAVNQLALPSGVRIPPYPQELLFIIMKFAVLLFGFIVFVFSLFLALLECNHFYEFMLIGLFFVLYYPVSKSLNKKFYLSLYFLFFGGGIIADLLLGILVTELWYYNYHYYFEYIPLYFLIYPLGGIVMVQTFIIFRTFLQTKQSKQEINKIDARILKILFFITLIFSSLIIFFDSMYGLEYFGFILYFLLTLSALFYFNYESEKSNKSYLRCLLKEPKLYIFITLLTAYVNAFIHEFPNTFAKQWTYQNFPLNDTLILNIPIIVFFVGWIALAIIPISVYYYVLSKVQFNKKT